MYELFTTFRSRGVAVGIGPRSYRQSHPFLRFGVWKKDILHIFGNLIEGIRYILSRFGTDLEVLAVDLRGQLADLFLRNSPLIRQVRFIPYQKLAHVVPDMSFYLFEPVVDIVEGLAVGQVEYDHDAICIFVEVLGYGPESLLAGCIPYL